MKERTLATWKLVLAYAAFSVAAFVFFFYLTFPYDSLKERVVAEAKAQGYDIHIGKMGPGLFGITAKNLLFRKQEVQQIEGMPESEPQALEIEAISVRPSLFPLGAAFQADLLGGTASGALGGLSALSIAADLDDLDLTQGNLEGFTGLKLAGILNGQLKLNVPRAAAPGGKGPSEPDFGKATGSLTLEGDTLTINGGTVVVPMYGQPTPMDLPKIILGDLQAKIDFDKGEGKIEALSAKSTDLNASGAGTIKLAKRIPYSELNLDLKFKIEDDLKKRLGPLSMGLSMLQRDPKDPTFNAAKVTGFLGRPNFR